MPITIFENRKGRLVDQTRPMGSIIRRGGGPACWQQTLIMTENTDLVVGNLGINSQFRASAEEPMRIYYGDFSGNGTFDPIVTIIFREKVSLCLPG